jgi:hypothetical protein
MSVTCSDPFERADPNGTDTQSDVTFAEWIIICFENTFAQAGISCAIVLGDY